MTRLGVDAEIATLRELAGAWDLDAIGTDDFTEMLPIIEEYRDQEIGVADASNVVLAHRCAGGGRLDRSERRAAPEAVRRRRRRGWWRR